MQKHLTEEQIRDALSRAEELHLRSALASDNDPAIESVLNAAEEMGLPREAMLKALQERLGKPMATPKVGERVFAKSADGKYYVAEVLATEGEEFRIRFLSGADATVSMEDLMPCNFVPGFKVVVQWPVWGWYKGDVVAYDAKREKVTVSDGWNEKKFSLDEIRLDPPKDSNLNPRAKIYWTLISIGAAMGGTIGAVITWLLMR
jgi:hypothetical protein